MDANNPKQVKTNSAHHPIEPEVQTTMPTGQDTGSEKDEVFFLMDSKYSAETLANELSRETGEDIGSIKSITSIEQNAEDLRGLDRATALDRSDVVHAAARGCLLGILMAMAVAALLTLMPSFENQISVSLLLVFMVLGGAIGAWFSTLIGVSVAHPRLQKTINDLSGELDRGRVLVLVTVKPKVRNYITRISNRLMRRHILASGKI